MDEERRLKLTSCGFSDKKSVKKPDRPGQQAAESAAAKAEKALYVDPTKWICTPTICSPIVGNFVVYFDAYHFTATYAAYLSGVLQTALKKVL